MDLAHRALNNMPIQVSIIVCTYNRAMLLDKLLESLAVQDIEGRHEIVVIDNNSKDETKIVVEKWMSLAAPNCPIRYQFVAQQGLSHARNAGVSAARGNVLAFIDDDAVASQHWLQRMVDNLVDETIACVSGKVIPAWSEPPPDWMTFELLPSVGGSIHGDTRRVITGKLYPMGGNMAIRKQWFQSLGGFNPQLGRVGTTLSSYEEIEWSDRLRRKGGIILFDPLMIIYHHVPPQRMTKAYIAGRRYWDGRSLAMWERIKGGRLRQYAVGAIRVLITVPRDLLGLLIHSTIGDHSRAFMYYTRLKRMQGYLAEVKHSLTAKVHDHRETMRSA